MDNTKDFCEWVQEDWEDEAWKTDCGKYFCFYEGKPSDNDARYCLCCGRRIVEIPYTEDLDIDSA